MKLFVPGRICLFGEHSDWAGGYRRINPAIEKGHTLICGTDQGLYAEVIPHPSALVLSAVTDDGQRHGPLEIPMEPQALLEGRARRFLELCGRRGLPGRTNYQVRGMVLDNYRTDLPVKKGLSSSAAVCVLAARAFNCLYDLHLTERGEMELAYQGEITTPSRCGRMDQGCAFGSQPVLMTFDGELLGTQAITVSRPLHFVVVDLQAHKDTLKGVLERLNRCYPNADTELDATYRSCSGRPTSALSSKRSKPWRAGDAHQLGALMNEAQTLFDRYAAPACPEGIDRSHFAQSAHPPNAPASRVGRQRHWLPGRWCRSVP